MEETCTVQVVHTRRRDRGVVFSSNRMLSSSLASSVESVGMVEYWLVVDSCSHISKIGLMHTQRYSTTSPASDVTSMFSNFDRLRICLQYIYSDKLSRAPQ
jgi:hypothetical protein